MKPRSAPKHPENRRNPPPRRLRWILLTCGGVALLCVGLYGVAAVYGAPWLVDRWLGQYVGAAPGRTASLETMRVNPLTLVAEITGLELNDTGAGTSFSVERLTVDFTVGSVLALRPVVSSVAVERPQVELASITDLTAIARRARIRLPGIARIDRLAVTDGTVAAGTGDDRTVELNRLGLTLTGFDGQAGNAGAFALDATTATGTTVAAQGSLAADLERADGQLDLGALDLGIVASRLDGTVAAVEPSGRMDLSAAFTARQLLDAPTLTLADAALAFRNLLLNPTPVLTATVSGTATAAELTLTAADDQRLTLSGRLETEDAEVSIVDQRATPPQSFVFDDAAALASADNDGVSLILGGRLRTAGDAALTVRAPSASAERRISIEAAELPATLLSGYAADTLKRGLAAGSVDLELDYALDDGRGDGSLHLRASNLEFADSTADDAGAPPLELAAALLENAAGIIELDLRFATGTGTVREALADALAARISAVTATPFDTLATLVDGAAQPASAVPFLPGDAALGDRAQASVDALAAALLARPRLGIRISPGYDAAADRDALARQQIELHVELATAGVRDQARPAPVDFGSPRAQDVLDEFAGERLPAERVATLTELFSCEGALADVCRRVYYERIFDALVANEEISPTTLNRLGRFRARSVASALQERGVAAQRIELLTGNNVAETPFGIGLPVELAAPESVSPASGQSGEPIGPQ